MHQHRSQVCLEETSASHEQMLPENASPHPRVYRDAHGMATAAMSSEKLPGSPTSSFCFWRRQDVGSIVHHHGEVLRSSRQLHSLLGL